MHFSIKESQKIIEVLLRPVLPYCLEKDGRIPLRTTRDFEHVLGTLSLLLASTEMEVGLTESVLIELFETKFKVEGNVVKPVNTIKMLMNLSNHRKRHHTVNDEFNDLR